MEQARAWDGDEGDHWVRNQHRYETMARAFTEGLPSAVAIEPSDRVLDIGCGNGQTPRLAARRASHGFALGVDLSAAMLDRARQDATDEGLTNAGFERADAQVHPYPPPGFDVAISRLRVMFSDDPVASFTRTLLEPVQPAVARRALDAVRDALRPMSNPTASTSAELPGWSQPAAPAASPICRRDRQHRVWRLRRFVLLVR